jgi:nucleoside-diphosphate-sugar epimerase
MRRVLLTGGAGFVGAGLARRLLHAGHDIHLLLRPGADLWRLEDLRADLRLHTADLTDAPAVAQAIAAARPEWVFHLAAHGAYSWQHDTSRIMSTNILGTVALVEACVQAGFAAFVHTGSSSEYGAKDHAPPETEWLEPNSAYAVAKASATLFCRYTAQRHGLHMPTLRLYSVYGPYEQPGRLLPTLVLRGLQGRLPPLAHPDTARDYVYTEDVYDACLLAASQPGQEPGAVYNVGTGIQTTLREVVAAAQEVLPIAEAPRWGSLPARQWDTSVWVADPGRIRAALGWHPRHTFVQGLRHMVDWLRAHPALYAYYDRHTPEL